MRDPFADFVLAASTADLSAEPTAREDADCLEFRMDLAERPADQLAAYDGELDLLVTNRAAWEGGAVGPEERPDSPADSPAESDRLDDLAAAVAHDASVAVDIELESVTAGHADGLLRAAADHDTRVVVSSHDFEGTPPEPELRERLETAATHGDVGKLAVTATDRRDVLTLLSVTHRLSRAGERVATMAMGEAGRHSRAVAPLYGSRIGYAPVDPESATAPGQYDLATLRSLLDRLA